LGRPIDLSIRKERCTLMALKPPAPATPAAAVLMKRHLQALAVAS